MLHRLVLFSVALVSLWVVVAAVVRLVYRDRVLPRTEVAGVSLGGTDERETRRRLAALAERPMTLQVRAGTLRTTVRAAALGFSLDVDRTLRRARDAGRDGPTEGVFSTVSRLASAEEIEPAYRVDRERLDSWIRTLARRVDRAGFPGAIAIDPDGVTVSAVAPRRGARLVRAAAATIIEDSLRAQRQSATLEVRRTVVPSQEAVDEVTAAARTYLARSLTLTAAGRRHTITRPELGDVLALEPVRGRELRVRLGVRQERLRALVRRIAARTDRAPVNARLRAPASAVTVAGKGELSWRPRSAEVTATPGRTGLALEQAAAARSIARAVRAGRHRATLPVSVERPAVSETAARRVRRLIGTFTTRFACCEPRAQNIRRIARAVDGTVIAAGGQFSLNGIAGPRTRAKGYVPAPFIADGKIVPSVGGGVSQFATTMFNAAYFAGLRLDAHQPHSLYIDRYPAGREATVDYGSIDLAWTNDTEAPVLVRAASTSTSVTVTLYGDNGGRRVRAVPGARQDVPGGDFSITVTRVIRYRDGRGARQPYTTTYDRPAPDD